jgi:hypothetical protein
LRPYLEKPFTKIGLVEWLKVKALSSNPSTTKKKWYWGLNSGLHTCKAGALLLEPLPLVHFALVILKM